MSDIDSTGAAVNGTTAKLTLTADRLRDLLHYNPISGVFIRKVSVRSLGGRSGKKCQDAGEAVGTSMRTDGYIRFIVDGRGYMAHRLAWLYSHGEFPTQDIDHRDGNRANNAICNLRPVTRTENNQNRHRARSDSASQLIGAYLVKNKIAGMWRSTIRVGGKIKHLGYFETDRDAHAAYCAAKRIYHPSSELIQAK